MEVFPLLSSGAFTQYPTETLLGQAVGIVRFLDGSDQRFLHSTRSLRRWRVDLSLLSDSEIASLEIFFIAQKGIFSPFLFTDPGTNTQIPDCRFAISEVSVNYLGSNNNSTSLWIMETNG